MPGDWLGLGFAKEEHYKLARIRLDLPNTVDDDWGLDVRKSRGATASRFPPRSASHRQSDTKSGGVGLSQKRQIDIKELRRSGSCLDSAN